MRLKRGHARKVTWLLIQKKDKEIGRREDEFIAPWRSVSRRDGRRRKRGEGNQTGWTARAHTGASCLMSR